MQVTQLPLWCVHSNSCFATAMLPLVCVQLLLRLAVLLSPVAAAAAVICPWTAGWVDSTAVQHCHLQLAALHSVATTWLVMGTRAG